MSGAATKAASIGAASALPPCLTSVEDAFALDNLAPAVLGSDSYRAPDPRARAHFRGAIVDVARGAWRDAREKADAAGYALCESESAVLMIPRDRGHARVALRPGRSAPVVLEVPHPYHDSGTAEEGRYLFDRLGARALVMAGSYRCSNAGSPSHGHGTTSVCGERAAYAESDMAHNDDTFFQVAHTVLSATHRDVTAVSLHGMASDGVSLSDGTRRPTAHDAPVARLAEALTEQLPSERVTTCNGHAGADVRYHLCGTHNVQGRLSNGFGARSIGEPARARGRFLHLEQARSVRAAPERVARAFERWLTEG